MFRNLSLIAALVIAHVPSALAQQRVPACDGNITIIRVDTIKPGKMQDFLAAVQAHQQWYKTHGYDDQVSAAKIIVTDDKTKQLKYSDSEMMTYHIQSPTAPESKHDAAWDAYVKQYNDSSEIKSTYLTCTPKTH